MDGNSKHSDPLYQTGRLIEQYKINDILKHGRLADTYLCEDTRDKTTAVLKALRPPLVHELQEQFLLQARALRKMEHPHILHVRDTGVNNNYPFLITDYVPHLTLKKVFPPGNSQPLAKFLPYLKQVVSALQYAHDRNILHGDISPENMLVDRNNHILLANFSIETITQNRERFNYPNGETIAYSAPEQIQGKPSAASDQYSLAIVVYELLSGGVPFTQSYLETAHQHMHTAPPPLREKGVSSRVEKIVMTALAKEPAKRFTTSRAFINALEQEQNSQLRGATGHRSAPPPPAVRQPLRPSTAPAPAPAPATAAVMSAQPAHMVQPQHYSPLPSTSTTPADFRSAPYAQPLQPAAVPPAPVFQDSPLAPRRANKDTLTRRAFTVGLLGLAVVGGAGGWYALSRRLAQPTAPSALPTAAPAATVQTVDNKQVLIFTGHLASVNALTWSPDGRLIASASDDTYVQVFDSRSGSRKLIYTGHAEEVAAVAWSPSGRFIVSGGQDGSAQVWNAASGARVFTYKGHTDRVNGVSWSSDSSRVASGSEDKTVQVWNATNGAASFDFRGHTTGVLCVGWQPDDSSVASGSWDGTLRDWATRQHGEHFNAGEQIFSYAGHGQNEVYALTWSPDGNFIASAGADQTVQISNGSDGTPRPPFFTGHRSKLQINPVRAAAWSPDGNFIASGDASGIIYVWRVAGRRAVTAYRGHRGAVNALAWSPEGKRIASASADNSVHVWQPGV
jgi:eukaryotic-like serine/threonine-protein kinase